MATWLKNLKLPSSEPVTKYNIIANDVGEEVSHEDLENTNDYKQQKVGLLSTERATMEAYTSPWRVKCMLSVSSCILLLSMVFYAVRSVWIVSDKACQYRMWAWSK